MDAENLSYLYLRMYPDAFLVTIRKPQMDVSEEKYILYHKDDVRILAYILLLTYLIMKLIYKIYTKTFNKQLRSKVKGYPLIKQLKLHGFSLLPPLMSQVI